MAQSGASLMPAPTMRKYLFPALLLLFLALNVAGYFYVVFELDGSTIEHKVR